MKDIKIKCNSVEEADAVLQMIEDRYPEVKWHSGNKPTGWKPYDSDTTDDAKIYFDIDRDCISYSISTNEWHKDCDWTNATSAKRFLRKSNTAIHIYQRGRMVIAHESQTGREAVAKCSPSDIFNFNTGASIALARLMVKTPEALTDDVKAEWKKALGIEDIPARVDHKFKVGDHVTLKEGFVAGMVYGGLELLEGAMYDNAKNQRMTVVRVDWSDDSNTYYCECKGDSQFTFHYSEEMLEKWDESKIHEGDTVRVINTGLNYSSYPQWVGEHISDPYMAARYCYGSPNTDRKYKVIKIAEHESNGRTLAYIEECDGFIHNRCYLIEVKGLEKV